MGSNNINDMTAYRRKHGVKSFLPKIIVLLIVVLLAFIAVFNIKKIAAPFKGVAVNLNIGQTRRGPAGYPVKLPGSAGYTFLPYDDGFMLLTDTYLYVYAPDGAQIYAAQHGYAKPRAAVGGKKILTYDRNNSVFALYGKSGEVFKNTVEEKIVYGMAGEAGCSAVVLKGAGYANMIAVYGEKGQWLYRHRFTDEHIMQIRFLNSDREIVVSAIGFSSGDNKAAVYRFTTDSEDDLIWKCELPDNALPLALYADTDSVYALCDGCVFAIDAKSGEVRGEYVFSGNVVDYDFSGGGAALLIDDFASGTTIVAALDSSAELTATARVSGNPYSVSLYDAEISVLGATGVTLFGADLTQVDFLPLSEEYSKFIRMGDVILALGYEKIDKISMTGDTDDSESTENTENS